MQPYILVLLIVLPVLAGGATRPVALMLAELACLAVLLWTVVQARRVGRPLYRPPGLLPLGLLGGLMLLQLLPLPPGLLRFVSPTTGRWYAESVWLLQPGTWMPLSINPARTLGAFCFWAAAVSLYSYACQVLVARHALRRVVTLLAGFAGVYALLSILAALLPNGQSLWILRAWPEYAGEPFGTYVNGNHFAGLMGMLLPLVIAFFLAEQPTLRYGGWREKLIDLFTDPQLDARLLSGFAALLAAVSIFLSLSRGGILSCLGALMLFGLLLAWRGEQRRRALLISLFAAVLFFSVGVFGWEPIFATFSKIRNLQGELANPRLVYWQDCLALLRDLPLFGSGFGSFIDVYGSYQTIYHGELVVDHAHNDYVELLVEGGAAAGLLALWACGAVLRSSWRLARNRRRRFNMILFLGSLAALSAILLHSITDFNLHIGANGLMFALLWALLVAAASTSADKRRPSELSVWTAGQTRLLVAILPLLLAGAGVFLGGQLFADQTLDRVAAGGDDAQGSKESRLIEVQRAAAWAPLDSTPRVAAANLLLRQDRGEESLAMFGRALARRPCSGALLQRAGSVAGRLTQTELAGALLQAGLARDRADLRRFKPYIDWLLQRKRVLEVFPLVRDALEMEPTATREYMMRMALRGVSWTDMAAAMPETAPAWLHYGHTLLAMGLPLSAEDAYRRAIALTPDLDRPSPAAYWALYRYFSKEERFEEALMVLRDALVLFPEDAGLHRTAGSLYQRQGLLYQAANAYRQALLLDPTTEWVRKRLESLPQN